jgi:hypothetical protein
VKLEVSINYSDNNEVSNNLVENSVEPQSLQSLSDHNSFCYQNSSTPNNTIQNDINNLDLSYNDIHVINQNFYYHQNFKEQIEDEFNRTVNEFEHIRCDQLKNKSSRRVTYGNPCYSIGSKADSIYFLSDRSVHYYIGCPKIRGTTL